MLSIQSPYSAEALVLEVETPFVYSMRNDSCRNVSNAEIGRWLNSHGEVRHVKVEDLTELRKSLALYVDCRAALRWALYSVDNDLDDSLRGRAISLLDQLLEESSVRIWLQDLFCLQALPEDSIEIAKTSVNYAKNNGLTHYVSFYVNVLNKQPVIRDVSVVWNLIEASSLFGNQHRDLMDHVLGTGLFERIVSAGAKPELLDMALLVLLKIHPNIGSNITKKVSHASIINRVASKYSEILGLENVVEGIEHLGLWSLVRVGSVPTGKPKISVRLKPTESPFILGHSLVLEDLSITCGNSNDSTPVPIGLVRYLETTITEEVQVEPLRIFSEQTLPESPGEFSSDIQSALHKVQSWSKAPVTGACQLSNAVGLF
ncbi:MAG: hypothetical protein Q8L15_14690 [Methylobacter sp.]|nr:hypothetical protein [Methylobacter sp.]